MRRWVKGGGPRAGACAAVLVMIAARGDATARPFGPTPFTASGPELRQAETAVGRGEVGDSTLLLDATTYRVERSGTIDLTFHRIVSIATQAGVERLQILSIPYAPWTDDQPVIRARVLDRGDRFHQLDPSTVEQSAGAAGSSHSVSDRRWVRAPLPALSAGSIVEITIHVHQRRPLFAAGSVRRRWFGDEQGPVGQSRLVIDAPDGMQIRIDERIPRSFSRRIERSGARTRRVYETAWLARTAVEGIAASDAALFPSVGLATGASWNAVARAYGALVRAKIAAGPLPGTVRIQRAATRRQTIDRAAEFVRRELRYTGLELGENEIAPWTPAQVWARRYGDCKDLATFLVALLATAGVRAEVALVDAELGEDMSARLPGLGELNHAIVYVPEEQLWIDPTAPEARPGQLSAAVQGRLAVVAAAGTRAPVRTPRGGAADNTSIEERRVVLAELGEGSVTEVSRYTGLLELKARSDFASMSPAKLRETLERYSRDQYGARRLARHGTSPLADPSTPLAVQLEASGASAASSTEDGAVVEMGYGNLFSELPADISSPPDAKESAARGAPTPAPGHPRQLDPHTIEWRYTIQVPDGFEPVSLPPSLTRSFGPGEFSQSFSRKGHDVRGTIRFRLMRSRVTQAEVRALRKGIAELRAARRPTLTLEHRATRRFDAGEIGAGLTEARRLVDAAPRSHGRLARFAYLAARAGLVAEAVDAARRAVALAPSDPWSQGTLGSTLRYDPVGRFDHPGFDRKGAIAAFEKATALTPDSGFYTGRLGVVLALGDDASYLGGDLPRAAAALERAHRLGETEHDGLLLQLLVRLRRVDALAALAGDISNHELAGAFRLAAAATDHELRRALAEVPTSARRAAALAAFTASVQVSDYDRARRIHRVAGDQLPAFSQEHRRNLRLVRQIVEHPERPAELWGRFQADQLLGGTERRMTRELRSVVPLPAVTIDPGEPVHSDHLPVDLIPTRQLVADLLTLGFEARSVGRAGPIEAIQIATRGAWGSRRVYLSREGAGGKELRVLGTWPLAVSLGLAALREAEAGHLEAVRKLLEWAWLEPGAPLSASIADFNLARFWRPGQRLDRRHALLAAAGLAYVVAPERAMAVLDRECAGVPALAEACRRTRAAALLAAKRVDEVAPLLRGTPDEKHAFYLRHRAYASLDRRSWKEVEELAVAGGDPYLQYALAASYVARDRLDDAKKAVERARRAATGMEVIELNDLAYLALFWSPPDALRPDLAALEQLARDRASSHAVQNTLGLYYAALGRPREALAQVHRSVVIRGNVTAADHLVLGRLAAAFGLSAAARREYELAMAGPDKGPGSVRDLSRRWMATLPR